ncbi:zinc finger BED domain-containing protein RICESLEEPER 2-like protein [Tanacetum coccineum]
MLDPIEEQSIEGGEALGSTASNVNKGYCKEYKERSEIWAHYEKYKDKDGNLRALFVDVPTRWNSTYLTLSVAIQYERVFDSFVEEDYVYACDLREGDGDEFEVDKKEGPPGIPESKDWANARLLVVFVKHFYDMTLQVLGTKYITSNSYLECINCLDTILKQCFLTDENDLKSMSIEMMKKFDKYWGNTKKFNMLVFIASVFYPRTKFKYLKVNLCSIAKETKTELDSYLTEEIEGVGAYFKSDNFTILGWWKKRSLAFPILSLVACNILAIPVSTVASESIGCRVLDSFRTSLTPQIVEALICCQDWIRLSHVPVNVEEKIEDLEKFEEELGPVCDGYIIGYEFTLVFKYQLFLLLPTLLVILSDLDTMCKPLFLKIHIGFKYHSNSFIGLVVDS